MPTSAHEVRSFLGLIGYYRRFVPNFGSIAKPLEKIALKTHKDIAKKKFVWTEEDQTAFVNLRNRLVTSPILAIPNFEENSSYLRKHVTTE